MKIIAGICGLLSLVLAYSTYTNKQRETTQGEGQADGSLRSDTQYIMRRIDEVLWEQRSINTTLGVHSERITRVEESAKQAHKRIDEIKESEKSYEVQNIFGKTEKTC